MSGALALLLMCLLAGAVSETATANLTFQSAGFLLSEGGQFSRQAGGHPDFTTSFSFPIDPNLVVDGRVSPGPDESVHDVEVELPQGMIGDPTGIAQCDPKEFAFPGQGFANCPLASQVGVAEIETIGTAGPTYPRVGLFNLKHGPEVPARLGFNYVGVVGLIDANVVPGANPGEYSISAGSFAISQAATVSKVKLFLWGVPTDSSHDFERGGIPSGETYSPLPDVPNVPFLSMPTSCTESPVAFTIRGDSWQNRGIFDERMMTADEEGTPFVFSGCERLAFAPGAEVAPTSRAADSPSGLSVDINIPQSKEPKGLSSSDVREVKMTLPQGMSVSSASASGLGACSLAEIDFSSIAEPTCPATSKIGSVTIDTPLLSEPLEGSVILATQNENPFNSLLALYIAVKGPGFWIKLPGKVDTDPQTGQLTVTFSNTPQFPFERLQVHLIEGPRAPLDTPRQCGSYPIRTEFTPWSGTAPVGVESTFQVDQGCSSGFSPGFEAGTADNSGGSFSPFTLRVTRSDGEPNLSRLNATLPEGLLAKLAGVTVCGDAQAATGDCPASSQVGKVTVGTGPGSTPLYVPEAGKAPTAVYLAGPYGGGPYSLVVKVPAQAGPFDLGTVAVRNALKIDPSTTQVTAESDPLPQILQGIPITYRDVRVEIDRSQFTVNPTNCSQKSIDATLVSSSGQTSSPSTSFAAAGCGELGFSPKLQLAMSGSTKRAGNPALSATLKAPAGQANIASTTVILPKTVFIDQRHVDNPCTRVQFAA
ncbi:MAG TPA: hypothetical protein VMF55_12560, partial [Solirubrobacterales bacterium]|nr:hypothetical protein [Solirubrobacterales bacterium]